MVALLLMSAKTVPLVSLAPWMVYIRALFAAKQSINPTKDSLRVMSAQVWGKSGTQSAQGV